MPFLANILELCPISWRTGHAASLVPEEMLAHDCLFIQIPSPMKPDTPLSSDQSEPRLLDQVRCAIRMRRSAYALKTFMSIGCAGARGITGGGPPGGNGGRGAERTTFKALGRHRDASKGNGDVPPGPLRH